MRKNFLILFGVLSLASPASAADWVFVGSSSTTAEYFIDRSSIRQEGHYLAAWRKVVNAKPDKFGDTESKALQYYDCANRRIALKSWVSFGPAGDVTGSRTIEEYAIEWSPAVPDSMGEAALKLVCGGT